MVDEIQQVETTSELDDVILSVTPAALDKIRELLVARNMPDKALRVFVQGGGCSGLSYGMAFEDQFYPQDNVVEVEGVKLVIDPMSLNYMAGSEIDFVDSLMGGGFAINNPNAMSSCGCGHSFKTKEGGADEEVAGAGCSCGHQH